MQFPIVQNATRNLLFTEDKYVHMHNYHAHYINIIFRSVTCMYSCLQHKCRRCLAPVCDNCSKKKLPISDPSSKPERVCTVCFEVISARRMNESKGDRCWSHILSLFEE